MLAAIFAVTAGSRKPGRMAFMSSSFEVAAASAAAVVQHSRTGAAAPLMSLRFNSARSEISNPTCSARWATRLLYSKVASMRSSSTLRSHPPKIGIQNPNLTLFTLLASVGVILSEDADHHQHAQ